MHMRHLCPRQGGSQSPHGILIWRGSALSTTIHSVAPRDTAVLVQGESGTGKEIIARQIHLGSRRRDGPFVPVDCAAMPGPLFESQLFGHQRGSFTGAVGDGLGLAATEGLRSWP